MVKATKLNSTNEVYKAIMSFGGGSNMNGVANLISIISIYIYIHIHIYIYIYIIYNHIHIYSYIYINMLLLPLHKLQ